MPGLPNEILLLIFHALAHDLPSINDYVYPYSARSPDLIKLLSICRAWYRLFLPKVYHYVQITKEQSQLHLLARSLEENPRLGAMIRRLRADVMKYDYVQKNKTLIDKTRTEPFWDLMVKVCADDNERQRWQKDLLSGSDDAWMAICLLYLQDVEILEMNYPTHTAIWVPRVLSSIATDSVDVQPMPLQYLNKVIVGGSQGFPGRPPSEFFPYFLLPSMRSFRAFFINESEMGNYKDGHKPPRPAPKSSSITELTLDYTYGCKDYITSCANLQTFQYEHTREDQNEHYPTWSPTTIYDALITQKHSLRVLRIIFNDGDALVTSYNFITNYNEQFFGSLEDFTQLHIISMPLGILLDFRENNDQPTLPLDKALPRSLEHLYVGEVEDENHEILATALNAMLLCRKQRFPVLKSIEIWFCELSFRYKKKSWFTQLRDSFSKVRELFLAEGVELCYTNSGWHDIGDEWDSEKATKEKHFFNE